MRKTRGLPLAAPKHLSQERRMQQARVYGFTLHARVPPVLHRTSLKDDIWYISVSDFPTAACE